MSTVVKIPLSSALYYRESISLEDQSYILEFDYVATLKLYTFSIRTADNTPLLSGSGLVPNYPMIRDYSLPGLTGYFILVPVATSDAEAYKQFPEKISEYYTMYYVYEE